MMTRSSLRFPTLKSCLDDFINDSAEDAAEDQELDLRWDDADWHYPFRVVSYTEAGTPDARGFLTHASAIEVFHDARLWPGETISVETREGVVTHHRGHTLRDEIDHCWDMYMTDNQNLHYVQCIRDYYVRRFLLGH